jgi:cytochrome P450
MATAATAGIEHAFPDIDFGLDELPDLHALLAQLQRGDQRVVPVRYIGGTAWLLFRHEDVYRAYRDSEHFPSSASYTRIAMPTMGRTIQCMEGEEHRIKRALVSGAFLPAAVRSHSERLLRPLANRLIDGFAGRNELDLVEEYCHRYPLQVITGLLGIPADDEAQLIDWIHGLCQDPWDPDGALTARAALTEYLLPIVHARRTRPQDDVISQLCAATVEGQQLDDEDILAFVRLLFPAGADTTYLTLGSMLNAVLGDAAIRQRLLADPALIPAAVEESLRLFGTVCLLPRYTETGFTLDGVEIPPHSTVLFGTAPAGRDAAAYPDPQRFDIERQPRHLVTFGGGVHFCLGTHLARAELCISLELLLQRLPGLRLRDGMQPATGAVLRGVRRLPIVFDAVLPALA